LSRTLRVAWVRREDDTAFSSRDLDQLEQVPGASEQLLEQVPGTSGGHFNHRFGPPAAA